LPRRFAASGNIPPANEIVGGRVRQARPCSKVKPSKILDADLNGPGAKIS
jgi:hypothetical protein